MAYLKPLTGTCQACHRRPATVEAYKLGNVLSGAFCGECGAEWLADQQRYEQLAFELQLTSKDESEPQPGHDGHRS